MAETIDFDELTFGPGALPQAFLDFFEIKGAEDLREVMLALFRSPLGEALQAREAAAVEVEDFRTVAGRMEQVADQTDAGRPDDYFIELVAGDQDDFMPVTPWQRFVFGFEATTWQAAMPQRIDVS